MSTLPHVKALERAKIALMTKPDTTFFCEIAFSLKYVWDENTSTAATDGVSMYINPEYFMKWSKEQQLGLILHESLHVAYMHMARKQQRNHYIYNIAADYVINLVIKERGFDLPEGGLYDPKYAGMNTEQVYDLLIQEAKENPSSFLNQSNVPGIGDDLLEPKDMTAGELEDHIQQTLIRASIRSQEQNDKPGTIPGDLEILINSLLKPKLPWNRILQKYLTKYVKSDYTWKKPNRRFFPDHYLPSMYSTALIDIAVAVDTSGSVSDEEFHRFVSEVASIFRMSKPTEITLIQFDTKIHSINKVKDFRELLTIKFKGRGGTDIQEVVEWTNTNKPQLLLVFTDGDFCFPKVSTKQNVLWLIHNNPKFKAQFGKAIHYGI